VTRFSSQRHSFLASDTVFQPVTRLCSQWQSGVDGVVLAALTMHRPHSLPLSSWGPRSNRCLHARGSTLSFTPTTQDLVASLD
jgi:hypothetical protein